MLATMLRFGPTDHGRLVSDEELDFAEYETGFEYEVIYGRLFVSPVPNPSHDAFEKSGSPPFLLMPVSRKALAAGS